MIIRKKNKIPGNREKARHQIAGCTPFDQLNVTGVATTCQNCIPRNGNGMAISYADRDGVARSSKRTGNILATDGAPM